MLILVTQRYVSQCAAQQEGTEKESELHEEGLEYNGEVKEENQDKCGGVVDTEKCDTETLAGKMEEDTENTEPNKITDNRETEVGWDG